MVLALVVGLIRPDTGLAALAIQYTTKDRLHFSASGAALFGVFANVPFFLAFLVGRARDGLRRWGPADRWIVAAGSVLLAGSYWAVEAGTPEAGVFTALIIATGFATQFLLVPMEAVLTEVGQANRNVAAYAGLIGMSQSLPGIFSGVVSGRLIDASGMQRLLLIVVGVSLLPLLFAAGLRESKVSGSSARRSPVGLAIVPIVAWGFVAFTPAWPTAQFYFLSNIRQLSPSAYGTFVSLTAAGTAVGSLAWSPLRSSLGRFRALVVLGILTLAGASGWSILGGSGISAAALLHGLVLGLSFACVQAEAMRLCPPGSEGSVNGWMIASGAVTSSLADLLGAKIFESAGIVIPVLISQASCLIGLGILFFRTGDG